MSSVPPAATLALAMTLSVTSLPGTHCPPTPPPIRHVASVEENDWCFHHPSKVLEQMPCREGYFRKYWSNTDSRCVLCPEGTFQSQKNNCPGCVQCRDCAKDGMVVKSPCTKTENTHCWEPPASLVVNTTTGDDIETGSLPLDQNTSSATTPSIPMNSSNASSSENDPTLKPAQSYSGGFRQVVDSTDNMGNLGKDVEPLEKEDNTVVIFLVVFAVVTVLFTIGCIAGCYMMKKKQEKIEQLERELNARHAALKALVKKDEQEEGNDGQERYIQVDAHHCNGDPVHPQSVETTV